jgi:signal transduction histidine kinase
MLMFLFRRDPMKPKPRISAAHIFIISLLAMLLVATTFIVDTVASRGRHLARGTQQLQYASRMLAMHTARSFDGIETLLDELEPQLAQLDHGKNWSLQQGHDFLKKHLTRSLPQIRALYLFNAGGDQRFTSLNASAPKVNVKDRPYFSALHDGAERTLYGPYIGRNTGQASYALAHRVESKEKQFVGVLLASTETNYFEELCWSTRPFAEFESALVNAEGLIIAPCRPASERTKARNISTDFRSLIAGGTFAGKIPATHSGRAENDDFILHAEPVPGYTDLRVISSIPKSLILTQWYGHLQRSLLLGGTALFTLGIAIWLIRRQLREISRFTTERHHYQLTLESRVWDATSELEQRREEAENMALAKARFLAAASHDLRQPMQALRLFVDELRRTPGGAQQPAQLQRIEQATDAMGQQLEDMIILSRLDMAGIEAQRENLSTNTLFRQLAAIYQPLAAKHGVHLVFLPHEAIVHSDPILLRSLLGKLIDNAIKFNPRGTVLVCARRGPEGSTRIEVRDNGSGIATKDQEIIYQEFFQLDNAARQAHTGLGLGLSIASRIARLLNIPLTLRSRPDAGSTFTLLLPAANTQPDTQAPADSAIPGLLLIGTDQENTQDFAAQAADWGYHLEFIDTPEAARPLLTTGNWIAVVFSDEHCVVCEKLRALLEDHPGIVIHPPGCQVAGRPYHLAKPVKPARLRALLRSLH